MTEQDYKDLESLMSKLQLEVKNMCSIIPYKDGVYLGVYTKSSVLVKETMATDIKTAVDKLKKIK
jgi:hypothetical protein